MYREALPVVVRNHIAEMKFSKETYKEVFKKSDQVFDSNQSTQPVRSSVAAVSQSTSSETPEVAAVRSQRGGTRGGRGNRGGARGGRGGASSGQSSQTTPATTTNQGHKGPRHATAKDDKLCKFISDGVKMGHILRSPLEMPN